MRLKHFDNSASVLITLLPAVSFVCHAQAKLPSPLRLPFSPSLDAANVRP